MGFFDRIFGRKSRKSGRWSASASAHLQSPGILLLLKHLPALDADAVCKALSAIEPLKLPAKYASRLAADDKPAPEGAENVFFGRFEFDSHVIDVVGLNSPAPAAIFERTVEASAWTGEGRESMLQHKAHCVLMHQGGGSNPLEKHIALFKLAAALGGEQCAGVLNEPGWTCAPAQVVREFAKPEMLRACRDQIPPIVFTGFIKFMDDNGIWFATKGHHMFGAPDFVLRGNEADKPSEVLDLFMNIFLYVIGSDRDLQPGHTMQIADEIYLRFGKLDADNPHNDVLQGPGRTLTITRISKDDINTDPA